MSTCFTLLVTGSPTNSQAHLSAIRFAKAALAAGQKIANIFFYQEAVLVASEFIIKPDDEAQLTEEWEELCNKNGIELQVCIAAGNRRGIIEQEEANLKGKSGASIRPGFKVLGLGQFAAALSSGENKLVHFK
ncbi:sulfurtransferase complex subunit TusD [Aliikangiella sp. G2MR2-5]|uniref:sulfurtransferase complex subunit TusD n=1 Tax=Aliikangiella sp. G2MR2-5 TaxID=2788943 RepID=UPI0018A9A6B5|nr:sulfurtransferase complex subunit TusD [Aliikangiella sp. G2MR2-5]